MLNLDRALHAARGKNKNIQNKFLSSAAGWARTKKQQPGQKLGCSRKQFLFAR
jgi:hypothetical protein